MKHSKKINWKHLAIASTCVIVPSLAFTASCGNADSNDTSIYRLQFNDVNNIGRNTAKGGFADASSFGDGLEVGEQHKDSHALNFDGGSKGSNYLTLPTQALANSETTIAMWLKMPKPSSTDPKTTLFGISFDENCYFYVTPYEQESWNGFGLHAKFGAEAEVNLTQVAPSSDVYGSETPLGGILQPIFDAWQLLGFTFTNNNLKVFQNGKEVLSYDGDYSLNRHNITSFKFGTANESTANDFAGSLSDIRVYNRALTQDDYQKEFETSYLDYKTIDIDFNNGNLNDSVRNYDGDILSAAKKNVIFEEKDGRKVAYLNGEGKEGDDARSGFYLPKGALTGHNELTISTNVYVEPRVSEKYLGQRLFDFSSDTNTSGASGQRFLAYYYTMYDLNRIRVGTIADKSKLPDSGINNDARYWVTDPNFSLPIRKWMNVTTVFGKNNTKVVVNGTTVAEGENSPYFASLFYDWYNCTFFFGRPNAGGSRALHCYVDDLQIYSTALTDSDIQGVMGNIHTPDDRKAVDDALQNFDITQCTRDGGGRIYPESHLPDGVLATIKSDDYNVVDKEGYLLYTKQKQECTLDVTLSRNGVSRSITIDFTVPAIKDGKMVVENNNFEDESYDMHDEKSYLWKMQELTFDWMNNLENDKLLYMYKVTAGLEDYDPEWKSKELSYGSWIRPACGGEGQFQGEYVGALARATNYTNYAHVDQIRKKLMDLLEVIRVCQDKYPTKAPYGDGQVGYLNAFTHLCYDELANGKGNVSKDEWEKLPFTENIWVPWYMYHKQLMMCYDTITYANMGNEYDTETIKDLAKSMLYPAARWAANKVLGFNKLEKEWSLHVEYGGMSEAMYLTYRLALEDGNEEDAKLFLRAARFFEEKFFIDALYDNSNLLSGIHVNTCIPKFNSCCAAYKVTGDRYYLQAAENAWEMMVNHMTMANGGLSSIGEHFEAPDHATQARFGEETCCSYNALRLTDYLYRFTGDAKYMHYFEKVFYNHILPSIDMVGSKVAAWDDLSNPKTYNDNQFAGKAYVMSTDFGHHITYSSPDDSFWCCVATGTESYSKLTYGNFYHDEDNIMYVNMYNYIQTRIPGQNGRLSISGLQPGNSGDKGIEFVKIGAIGDRVDLSKIRFIKPSWVASAPVITKGSETIDYVLEDDYMTINTTLEADETITISLPMKLESVAQRGYRGEGDQKYSYALYYGPYMLVLDLGKNTKLGDDIYLHNGDGSDQSGQHPYDGDKTQTIKLKHHDDPNQTPYSLDESVTKVLQSPEIVVGADGHAYFTGMVFTFATANQGNLTFRPFMDINYERYSFYMFYNAEL